MTYLIFINAAEKAGWTHETQVQVLLDYISKQNSDAALEDFLNQRITEETENSRKEL